MSAGAQEEMDDMQSRLDELTEENKNLKMEMNKTTGDSHV
jgi:regulator of replication initiation timing